MSHHDRYPDRGRPRSRSRSRSRSPPRGRPHDSSSSGGGGGGRYQERYHESRGGGGGGGGRDYAPHPADSRRPYDSQAPPARRYEQDSSAPRAAAFGGSQRGGYGGGGGGYQQHQQQYHAQQHPHASSSYGGSAAASASSSSAGAAVDGFARFQQALEQHNAARKESPAAAAADSHKPSSGSDHSVAPDLVKTAALELAARRPQAASLSTEDAVAPVTLSAGQTEALAKPVYLTKAQRAEAALAKLEEKRKQQELVAKQQELQFKQFVNPGRQQQHGQQDSRAGAGADRRAREELQRKRADEELQRRAAALAAAGPLPSSALGLSQAEIVNAAERERELIRLRYLGQKDPLLKREPVQTNQKNKFVFDWSQKEDTSILDGNLLYKYKHDTAALFGRGFSGGVDRKEQRKKQNFYEDFVEHRLRETAKQQQLQHRDDEDDPRDHRREQQHEQRERDRSQERDEGRWKSRESGSAVKREPMEVDEPAASASASSSAAVAAAASAPSASASSSSSSGPEQALALMRDPTKVAAREAREEKKRLEYAKKSRHWSEKALAEMEERDWRIFKEDFSIQTRGTHIPHPLRHWKEAQLPPNLMRALESAGYTQPTPIQRAAITIGLKNRDVVGIAETGSGKTAAFLVPMLVYISHQPPVTPATSGDGPYSVVMAPTRELAQQISAECDKFSQFMGIKNVCVVGGLSIEEQAFKLREGAEVIIGTPGRLFDCVQKRYLALNQCNYIVLDEADRMIDIGFEAQICSVMDCMPATNLRPENEEDDSSAAAAAAASSFDLADPNVTPKVYRQTVMFSATMPARVEALAKKYLRNPIHISVGDRQKAAQNIEQRVEWITSDGQKKTRLLELVRQGDGPFIVFSNLKANIEQICKWLTGIGVASVALHGSKNQEDRMAALASFKAGDVPVLVATDVAGRGLDVQGVKQVINYDLPVGDDAIDKYKHRCGRVGRAGMLGVATSFLTESDTDIMWALKETLVASKQHVPPQLANHEAVKAFKDTLLS